jgi:hypothetical protein
VEQAIIIDAISLEPGPSSKQLEPKGHTAGAFEVKLFQIGFGARCALLLTAFCATPSR